MPVEGGRPTRRTYGIDNARVTGWTRAGEILFSTNVFSTLPNWQLVRLDVSAPGDAGAATLVPLAQAADGSYSAEAGPAVTAIVTAGILRSGRTPDDPLDNAGVAAAIASARCRSILRNKLSSWRNATSFSASVMALAGGSR